MLVRYARRSSSRDALMPTRASPQEDVEVIAQRP
jgi:hypothetical protein